MNLSYDVNLNVANAVEAFGYNILHLSKMLRDYNEVPPEARLKCWFDMHAVACPPQKTEFVSQRPMCFQT